MSHALIAVPSHAGGSVAGRPKDGMQSRAATAFQDGLRPARGLMLGLGLSSLIWTALVALVLV